MPTSGPDPLVPSFGEGPRNESKGERIQRYAENLRLVEKLYKLKLEESERLTLAQTIDTFLHLTVTEQKSIIGVFLDMVHWVAKYRPPDDES